MAEAGRAALASALGSPLDLFHIRSLGFLICEMGRKSLHEARCWASQRPREGHGDTEATAVRGPFAWSRAEGGSVPPCPAGQPGAVRALKCWALVRGCPLCI